MIFGFFKTESEKAKQNPFCRLSQFKINGTKKKFLRFLNSFRSTGLIYYGDEARENEWFFDKITDEYPDLIRRISRLKLMIKVFRSCSTCLWAPRLITGSMKRTFLLFCSAIGWPCRKIMISLLYKERDGVYYIYLDETPGYS